MQRPAVQVDITPAQTEQFRFTQTCIHRRPYDHPPRLARRPKQAFDLIALKRQPVGFIVIPHRRFYSVDIGGAHAPTCEVTPRAGKDDTYQPRLARRAMSGNPQHPLRWRGVIYGATTQQSCPGARNHDKSIAP
jgi:hypothetical protein